MSEFEAFARDWEATERSRHARLIEQLKREYREVPRISTAVAPVINAPYSVRLQRSLAAARRRGALLRSMPRQQNKSLDRLRSSTHEPV